MQEERKKKTIKWLIIIGLIVLVTFVIITSIIIYNQQKKLDDLKDKNEQIIQETKKDIFEKDYKIQLNIDDFKLN